MLLFKLQSAVLVTDQLSSLVKPVYLNPEVEIGTSIAVCVKSPDGSKRIWFELKVKPGLIADQESRDFAYDDFLEVEETKNQINQAGINMIEVEMVGVLAPREVLSAAVLVHCDKLFPESSS